MIVAALCWFNEPVPFLQRCVKSLAGVADHLVAYDGPWEHYPHTTLRSTTEAWQIARAAASIGLPYEIDSRGVWESQVAKREALMAEARQRGDWVLVIDGDEWIHDARPYELRAALDSLPGDVVMVGCSVSEAGAPFERPNPIRRLYRSASGVTVETAHNGYRTADGRWLHGDSARVPLEPAVDLSRLLMLRHERGNRGGERDAARLAYRKRRRELDLETWRGRVAA